MGSPKRMPPPHARSSNLQDRLEDYRLTLDQELSQSAASTAESSPRFKPAASAAHSRRMLPRLPISRDQFLQDPDGFHISSSELEVSTDASDGGGGGAEVAVPALQLTDRASSPASVVSAASSTASGMLSGRKHLEWDSGADLGYLGDLQASTEGASGLSTLEKMAIGNYSGLLRTEPEGKSAKSRGSTRPPSGTSSSGRPVPPRSMRTEDDLRQARLQGFADSLMRQRELRRMAAEQGAAAAGNRGASPQARRRSKSRESSKRGGRSDNTPESSPGHGGGRRRQQQLQHRGRRRQFGSPVKSSSLTDLKQAAASASSAIRPSQSNYDLPSHYMFSSAVSSARGLGGSSEPSSYSSAGTVVPILRMEEQQRGAAQQNDGDVLLYQDGAVGGGDSSDQRTGGARGTSTGSLVSKRSGSRSFETVINLEQQHHKQRRNSGKGSGGGRRQQGRTAASGHDISDSVEDTEEEVSFKRRRSKQHQPKAAWEEEEDEEEGREDDGGQHRPSRHREQHRQASRTSSAVTTSDEERHNRRKRDSAASGTNNPATATSTMESMAQIDRAKSFEYFPGESFPIQENSSSYEYLPGHMVSDRPGTVVSNYRGNEEEDRGGDGGVSGVSSLPSESTSSEVTAARRQKRKNGGIGGSKGRARAKLDLRVEGGGGGYGEEELNERARELLHAHAKKTRKLFRRMRKCLEYVTAPSDSAEDSAKKQEALDQLMALMDAGDDDESVATSARLSEDEHTTRQVQTETVDGGADEDEDEETAATKLVTDPLPSTSSAKKGDDVSMQKKRLEQVRIVRREFKRLERMESAHLAQMLSRMALAEEDKQDVFGESDNSSLASHSDMKSKTKTQKQPAPVPPPPRPGSTGAGAAGKKRAPAASGSSNNRPKSTETYVKRTINVTKSRTHLLTAGGPPFPKGNRSDRPEPPSTTTSSSTSTASRFRVPPAESADFGQTYPTPREEEQVAKRKKAKKASKGVQTSGGEDRRPTGGGPPVAYYLPLGGQSAVRLGIRRMAASAREEDEDGEVGKENRNILANYLAGTNDGISELDRKRRNRKREEEEATSAKEETRRRKGSNLTLSDALVVKRPDFVDRAERRREHLAAMRRLRLEHEEARRRWADDIAAASAAGKIIGGGSGPPPPLPVRVKRLFSHREMVEETRRRFLRLPEVTGKKKEARRRASMRTNRVIGQMYKRRLQEGVLKGRVSMSHHSDVLKSNGYSYY